MSSPITYTRQFSHKDWIDFVDSVQAGGTNGINARMHAIEAEFDKLSQVVAAISSALQSQPGLTLTGFSGVDVPGGNLALAITGNGFTAPTTVEFQKTSTTFTTPIVLLQTNVTPTQISVPIDQIPADAVTGKVRVQSAGQTLTSSFDVTPPAIIATLTSPVTGNQLCTITGSRFIPGATTITFANGTFRGPGNGFPATGESLTGTQIIVRVPATSPSGPIKISTPGGTVQSATSLTVN
ncbi:MAG: hypothetical protein ACXU71_10720 [Croceibacterium sp.]|jgi:hypothetical protein